MPRTRTGASNDIEARVKEIVYETLGTSDAVESDSRFIDDLGADSLDLMELTMNLEDEYSIEIPDEDADHILRVSDAVKYIEKHAQRKELQ